MYKIVNKIILIASRFDGNANDPWIMGERSVYLLLFMQKIIKEYW